MRFAMSYSCGKDSTLALHKMIGEGHVPVCLVIMVNKKENRSYFHGADMEMLRKYETALGLPVILCPSDGADYHMAFEEGLRRAKAMGAEAAAFGDIDIEGNRRWEEERCEHTGLIPFFPLWQCGREDTVCEVIRLGYRCVIKSLNPTLLPESLLGRYIDEDSIQVMEEAGIDICGENGEYHTLTVDGPVFRTPLDVTVGSVLRFGGSSVVDIK